MYPLYLPYQAQYGLFIIVQQLLEQACYEFSLCWFPDILTQKGWQCSEAIDLHIWTQAVVKHLHRPPGHFFRADWPGSIGKALIEMNKIRDTAVHCLHTSIDGLLHLFRSALVFTSLIEDDLRSESLAKLLYELESKAQALTMNKNFLEQKIEKELDEIARARDELRTRERNF